MSYALSKSRSFSITMALLQPLPYGTNAALSSVDPTSQPDGPRGRCPFPVGCHDFGKSLKPTEIRQPVEMPPLTAGEEVIRYYAGFPGTASGSGRDVVMNDKGGDFKGSMQHFT